MIQLEILSQYDEIYMKNQLFIVNDLLMSGFESKLMNV